MATKDKCHDPPVNYESDDSDIELNNSRQKSDPDRSSPPIWYHYITNDLRQGGPLADNDKKGAASGLKQKIGNCIACDKKGVPLWQGNRYRCHAGGPEKQSEHNSFCKSDAGGFDEDGDVMACPIHGETAWPKSEKIEPKPVYE